ncbi:FAD-dependent monooxygenase [Kribbella sandramycini]
MIGGGIAGLTAAAALLRSGWRVKVLESAPELGEVGAGLAVTANGLNALAAIDAAEAVERAGFAVQPAGTRRADGKWLLKAPESGSRMVGIHRRRLQQVLLDAAAGADVVTGARVTAVEPDGVVSWGRYTESADLVVGADGIRSATRQSLFPAHELAYSGFSSWRAVVPDAGGGADRFAMVWGRRAEYGELRISADEVYWYAYVALPAAHRFPDELQAARDRFAGWAPDVQARIAATQQVIRHDVWVLRRRLPYYSRGRTVLIGDAAHPMLPTLGQGANSALEDGVTLGRLLPADCDLAAGLQRYEAARYRRTQLLVRRSAQMARFGAHLGRGLTLRDSLLRIAPAGAAQRSGNALLDWR